MSPIASLMSHIQMRRSVTGARATDPVVADHPRRSRRLSDAFAARISRPHTRVGVSAGPDRATSSPPKTAEGGQTA